MAQLRAALGGMGALGSAYVLGDALNGLQWHVFVADAGPLGVLPAPPPVYTLEICMTHLCHVKVRTSRGLVVPSVLLQVWGWFCNIDCWR